MESADQTIEFHEIIEVAEIASHPAQHTAIARHTLSAPPSTICLMPRVE